MPSFNPGARGVAKRLPAGSVGVEIGVFEGCTSEWFLERCSHLHLVDPWSLDAYPDVPGFMRHYRKRVQHDTRADWKRYFDDQHDAVARKFAGKPVTIHRMTSAEFFDTFTEKVDWVYIDGLHSYEAVKADLAGAARIVRPGGIICGDDYGNKPGVAEAVDEFAPHRELMPPNQYWICVPTS